MCTAACGQVRRLGLVLLATLALPATPGASPAAELEEEEEEAQQQAQQAEQAEQAEQEEEGLHGEQAGPEELSARLPRLPAEQVHVPHRAAGCTLWRAGQSRPHRGCRQTGEPVV